MLPVTAQNMQDIFLFLIAATDFPFGNRSRNMNIRTRAVIKIIFLGETKKQLRVMISQHKGISFRTNRPLSSFDSSKIYDHAFDSNHPISDDSFKILSNSNVFDLKVLESLYIHKLQPNLNDYNSSFDLHIVK